MEIPCKKLMFLQEDTTLQTERAVKWTLIAPNPLNISNQPQTFGCRLKWRWEQRLPRCPWCCPCPWHSPLQGESSMAHLEWHPRGMGLSRHVDQNSSQQVWNRECVGSFSFFSRHVRNTGIEEHTWKLSEMQSSHAKRLWLFLFSLLLSRSCKRISYGTFLHQSGVCDAPIHRLSIWSWIVIKSVK